MVTEQHSQTRRWNPPTLIAFLVFAGVAAFYLWTEHRTHLLGVLPYLLFLICPLMHFFMHRGHSGHDGHGEQAGSTASETQVEHAEQRGRNAEGGS